MVKRGGVAKEMIGRANGQEGVAKLGTWGNQVEGIQVGQVVISQVRAPVGVGLLQVRSGLPRPHEHFLCVSIKRKTTSNFIYPHQILHW